MNNSDVTKAQKLSYMLLRILGSGIFLLAGSSHLMNTAGTAARLEAAPFGYLATALASAELLVMLSGIALLGGGLLLLIGYQTRLAALSLALVLIPITLTVQISSESLGPLFKNIAIMGILIFFIFNGALAYSLDTYMQRKKGLERRKSSAQTGPEFSR
ncbi:MAG: DoxX family membrane protein [Cyclonatronaceae bacterium]